MPLKDEYIIKLSEFFNVSSDYLLGLDLEEKNFDYVPIVGKISAGKPILAQENIEGYLPVDPTIYGFKDITDLFLLKVSRGIYE